MWIASYWKCMEVPTISEWLYVIWKIVYFTKLIYYIKYLGWWVYILEVPDIFVIFWNNKCKDSIHPYIYLTIIVFGNIVCILKLSDFCGRRSHRYMRKVLFYLFRVLPPLRYESLLKVCFVLKIYKENTQKYQQIIKQMHISVLFSLASLYDCCMPQQQKHSGVIFCGFMEQLLNKDLQLLTI